MEKEMTWDEAYARFKTVYRDKDIGWVWCDDMWRRNGPYPSKASAQRALLTYTLLELQGKKSYLICA